MQSFAEYANATNLRRRIGCAVCAAGPEMCAEVAKASDAGFKGVAIAGYMRAQGHDVTQAMIARHIRQGHECKHLTSTAKKKPRK